MSEDTTLMNTRVLINGQARRTRYPHGLTRRVGRLVLNELVGAIIEQSEQGKTVTIAGSGRLNPAGVASPPSDERAESRINEAAAGALLTLKGVVQDPKWLMIRVAITSEKEVCKYLTLHGPSCMV